MKLALIIVCVLLAATAALAAWLYTPDESRAVLEDRYRATPADFLPVDGLRLYVRDSGPRDAPSVILLHGFGASLQTWDGWAAALSARHRVIRFDLPGFGLTGADPTGDYSDRRTVQVLAALMDKLGLAHAALVGNSLGGKIAWNFAATYPNRVDHLVLVSPDGFASPGFEYNKRADIPWMMKLLPYTLPKSLLRQSIAPAFADPALLTPPLMTRYYDMMRAPGVRTAMLARMAQVMLEPPEAALHRITAPTLLIWGERDAMIPYGNAADYLRNIPGARLVSFPHLGHVPQEEAPAKSVAPVIAFLDEHVK
jgi:pimeloyl-ACP methyl ester carboxylesterase